MGLFVYVQYKYEYIYRESDTHRYIMSRVCAVLYKYRVMIRVLGFIHMNVFKVRPPPKKIPLF